MPLPLLVTVPPSIGGAVQRQRRPRIDRDLAGIGDIDLNIERAAGYLDGARAEFVIVLCIFEVAACWSVIWPELLQQLCIQDFHQAANGDGSRIFDNRVGVETNRAADRQGAVD